MDAKLQQLKEKLEVSLNETARLAAEIQRIEHGKQVPHYDQIEIPAHELGKRLSLSVQAKCTRELAAEAINDAACPSCGRKCRVSTKTRTVTSIDGPIEVSEPVAKCRRCRRSFFPSA